MMRVILQAHHLFLKEFFHLNSYKSLSFSKKKKSQIHNDNKQLFHVTHKVTRKDYHHTITCLNILIRKKNLKYLISKYILTLHFSNQFYHNKYNKTLCDKIKYYRTILTKFFSSFDSFLFRCSSYVFSVKLLTFHACLL